MKNLFVCDKATVRRLEKRLKQAENLTECKRIQCVLMRAVLGRSAIEIAQLLGWSVTTVYVLHSRWIKEGETIFDVGQRGGRHRQNLTPKQEMELLKPFAQEALAGKLISVTEIQRAYLEGTGKTVPRSTIYRLLRRHGWRKIMPRPRHLKADAAAQAAFKKTPSYGTPRGLAPG